MEKAMTDPLDPTVQSEEPTVPLDLQKARTKAGLLVIICGDLAITLAAIVGVIFAGGAQAAAVLTSAFTAVSTMTTAYFGIRAVSNTATAQSSRGATPSSPPKSSR